MRKSLPRITIAMYFRQDITTKKIKRNNWCYQVTKILKNSNDFSKIFFDLFSVRLGLKAKTRFKCDI